MHEQLKLLIELQGLDSSILTMADRIDEVPRQLSQHSAPLKAANEAIQKSRTKFESLTKKKKDRDSKLDEIQDKITKLKARSSDIKTNKEFEANKKEIASFEKNIYQIEDEILVLMEEMEGFEDNLKADEAKVKKAEEDFKHQEKLLVEEQDGLRVELEEQKAKRNEFASKIDKDYYNQYMVLLKRLGDKAVVEARNEICLGCHTNIPPQLYSNIKKDEGLCACYYCKRFLYYIAPAPAEEKPKDPPAADSQSTEAPPTS